MLYVAIWYVSIRPVVMRVKEELLCNSPFSPKHGELLNVMNKINHQICILLDYRYIDKVLLSSYVLFQSDAKC